MNSLDALFQELRAKYFPGRLLGYRVTWWSFGSSHKLGECVSKSRILRIQKGLTGEHLVETLLHEMSHVGSPHHGENFRAGIERLKSLGAPIAETDTKPGIPAAKLLIDDLEAIAIDCPSAQWKDVKRHLANSLGISGKALIRGYPWVKKRWKKEIALLK
jgi:hypothetical protein